MWVEFELGVASSKSNIYKKERRLRGFESWQCVGQAHLESASKSFEHRRPMSL